MIYDLGLSWRSIRARPVQTFVPMLVVGLAIALSVATLALSDGVQRGVIQASDPFGVLVVGPKGDGQQLVLNSVLLQGNPVGTIPFDIYEDLENDPRVRFAVPLAKGDNIGGAPIIGTDENFFELRTALNAPPAFQLSSGALFDQPFEAVLGAQAANDLGLGIGDQFQAAHGTGPALETDIHEQTYTVVGILHPSGTPYDIAVYTPYESVWTAHGFTPDDDTTAAQPDDAAITPPTADAFTVQTAAAGNSLTSVLVVPADFVGMNQIWTEFYTGTQAQAAFPGQELGGLFDLLRQAQEILTIVGYLVLVIAAMTVFLSIYSATKNREQDIAIMRSLGSSRLTIFRMVIFETLLLAVVGALLGRLIGYAVAFVIGALFTQSSAIPVLVRYLVDLEPLLWAIPVGLGLLAGLIPAAMAYRVDVVQKLFST